MIILSKNTSTPSVYKLCFDKLRNPMYKKRV